MIMSAMKETALWNISSTSQTCLRRRSFEAKIACKALKTAKTTLTTMQEENTLREEEKGIRTGFKINNSLLEDKQNLIGFFSILLMVDKRVNPQNYKPKKEKQND